ncbi:ABC transporter, ATP-binding protein [Corynebacterium ulcerans FRC58]|uniref:ABC transporter, ATP-binding protein n=1 Tax=Corynebacterium ulcerans FRC58 TaxID=1408268 RepID=A0ABN4GYA1_CORUL|nr:ABC transporter, ATP-binding protein [Corynebacterium ulcerans FRC58]
MIADMSATPPSRKHWDTSTSDTVATELGERGQTDGLRVEARGLQIGYAPGEFVVDGLDLTAEPGTVTTLLGPNGCGKSTVLKSLSRVLTPQGGTVTVGGHNVHRLPPREVARMIGMLPQSPLCPQGLTVGELVARGRHPHQRRWMRQSEKDRQAIGQALEHTNTAALVDCDVSELSGGQRQRVWMAMVVAQETPVVLLDEPTTYLDPAHAIDILKLAKDLASQGKTVIMVLHDLMLAGTYSDRLVLLKAGEIVGQGSATEVLTQEKLAQCYGLRAEVWEDPRGQAPVIVPRGTIHLNE